MRNLKKTLMTKPDRNKSQKNKRGQSLLEYILLMAGLSVLSTGFVSFFGKTLLKTGFEQLPEKAGACISHPPLNGGGDACQ